MALLLLEALRPIVASGDSAIKWGSSAKGGCSADNSSSLATGDSAIKWGSSAKCGCSAANSSSLATGDSVIKWGSSAKCGCSAANSSSLAAGDSGNPFTHSNMERKHTHVSWETTVTAVMVTVLLISLATAEVGETLALPRENKAERAADRARARSSLPPGKNDSSSEDDYDAHHRGVRQVLKDFQAVEETYCQGFIITITLEKWQITFSRWQQLTTGPAMMQTRE